MLTPKPRAEGKTPKLPARQITPMTKRTGIKSALVAEWHRIVNSHARRAVNVNGLEASGGGPARSSLCLVNEGGSGDASISIIGGVSMSSSARAARAGT